MGAKNKGNELKITRIYDAPVKAVWDAWTDPKQVAQWWGPRGFTITTHSKDLRPGGIWHYTMHGPDGVDYPNKTVYHEVEKYSRLVYDHGGFDERKPLFTVAVNFIDLKGKTKMEMTMSHVSPEALEQTKQIIKAASGNSTWDRLAEYLEKESSGKEKFVINRTFAAPITTMFEMFTDAKHFSKWIAPKGADMHFIRSDIKQGGSTFCYMTSADGSKMYGRANYLEISAPNRVVYTQQFVDEKENVVAPAFAPTWPKTMLTTVQLADEGDGQTRVTVTWEVTGDFTAEQLATFVTAKAGMTQGWTGSFDKLEEYVASNAH